MSRHKLITLIAALGVATFAAATPASAQVIGTFPWQMQPYCNIVTLAITNGPGGYTLDGTDDQCGASNKASAVGVASLNASGNVTLNFTIVTAPAGKPVHVSAVVSPANGAGTWTDSVGNNGTFAFFGNTAGLPARPLPASGLPASIITTTEIAAGAVGGTDINTAEVQARVAGTCAAGEAISGINANGTVTCVATDVSTQFRAAGHSSVAAASGAFTAVGFGTTTYNLGGGTYNSATGAYTIPQTGLYLITAAIRWASFTVAAGTKCIAIQRNGSTSGTTVCEIPSTTASHQVQNASGMLSLTAGDVVRIAGYQESGAAATLAGSGNDTHFSVTRIR